MTDGHAAKRLYDTFDVMCDTETIEGRQKKYRQYLVLGFFCVPSSSGARRACLIRVRRMRGG